MIVYCRMWLRVHGNALFARYVVSLVDIVEHAYNVGMIGKVRDGGA